MESWASEELRYVQLGDARLNRRLVKMVETFSENPECSVPKARKTWADILVHMVLAEEENPPPGAFLRGNPQSLP